MSILYVATLGTWGGVQTYLYYLIRDQVIRGNNVYVLLGTKGALYNKLIKNYPSVKVIILHSLKRNVHIIDMVIAIIKFHFIVKEINPNIVHLNSTMAGIIGRLGCLGLRKHMYIIYTDHGWVFEHKSKFKYISILVEKLLSYVTDKIICVSNYEYKIANKYNIFRNKDQGIIIKNGVPNIKVIPSVKLDDDVFRVTMAARFCNQKDQSDLIRAFSILIKKLLPNKKIKLYLLGDGPNLNYCKSLAKELELHDNIIFTGTVNNVLDYYNKSNVIVLITNYEGLPISLIEALSMGKPIVASDVSGVPENFDNNGYCIPNVPNIIANSLKSMYLNKKLRYIMGYNSKKLFKKEFSIKKNLALHNELYLKFGMNDY